MSKDSSNKYYQNEKETIQKKLLKHIKSFLKNKKKNSDNMVVKDTKIYHNMKNKSKLSIAKGIIKSENNALL